MVLAREHKDLLSWTQRTLLACLKEVLQDGGKGSECVARTPWENLEIVVAEAEVDGNIRLLGKADSSPQSAALEFELEVGIRVNVVKRIWYFGDPSCDGSHSWPAIVQIADFETRSESLQLTLNLDEVPAEYADEVSWYLREGMGHDFLWHALELWRAQAVKKWLQREPRSLAEPRGVGFSEPRAFRQEPQRGTLLRRGRPTVDASPPPLKGPSGTSSASSAKAVGTLTSERDCLQVPCQYLDGAAPGSDIGLPGSGVAPHVRNSSAVSPGAPAQDNPRAAELCQAIADLDFMKVFRFADASTVNWQQPETGYAAVHWCVIHNSVDMLEVLLNTKVDVDAKDRSGRTALMMAVQQGSLALTRRLLDAGANVAETDAKVRSLGELVPKALPDGDGIRELVDQRERPVKFGRALIAAIKEKNARAAEAAIDAGGDVGAADGKGDAAMAVLAKGKWGDEVGSQVRLAEKLARAGALVNAQNEQGASPMHFATHRGNRRLVSALLELRADTSLSNKEGSTPLMFAAHGGDEELCNILLEAFSPASAKNKFGLTAEQIAAKRGFQSCAVLIQAFEIAPKSAEDDGVARKMEKQEEKQGAGLDYSKWNALERRMAEEEGLEAKRKDEEHLLAMQGPAPRWDEGLARLGPEQFGRPAGSPWPPPEQTRAPPPRKKGTIDYSHWERVVNDVERRTEVMDRREHLEQNPEYVWRNGTKMRVMC
mmetsp:Transcript_155017/g.496890  ORF Transcript_155017/g.496890 Transcript_155017/m.496890 type:complete len:714 (-) Transcript_155017:56-2197(-)